jgi:hypothetical protein
MNKMCETVYSNNNKCSSAANLYAMGTMMFGNDAFQNSQNDYCTCTPLDNVPDYYSKLLGLFYLDYNAERIQDAKSIVDNYIQKKVGENNKNPSTKLYKLYYELHKKYTNAIKHNVDRSTMKEL